MRVLYGLADAVLCPSTCFDAFLMVCLEAGAAGAPVLATSLGGAREIVDDGVSGRLLDPFDPARWAEAILDLVTHPERARALGQAGREQAARRFDIRAVARTYLSIFATLATDPRARCAAGRR
jgi:glycosyltransferase involved in cell wall biosynthesis